MLYFLLFVGLTLLFIYGIEFLLPPFGEFLYINPVKIIVSISYHIAYKLGIGDPKYVMLVTTVIVLIIPAMSVIFLNNFFKKREKRKKSKFLFDKNI